MLDQPIRVAWLDSAWRETVKELKAYLPSLPEEACVTVGFPPTRARGKREQRKGCYVSVGEWKGNAAEKAFVSVHPERMTSAKDVVKAMVEEGMRVVHGARRARRMMRSDGRTFKQEVENICERIGDPPKGYADIPDPTPKDRCRMRKFACECVSRPIVRSATDDVQATCKLCGKDFVLVV